WFHVYRQYLEFMYLNNAYHFYSPEPGPPSLVWFYVRYEDDSGRWIKIPQREDFPTKVAYQRRLSLTESINQLLPPGSAPPGTTVQDLAQARAMRGQLDEIPTYPGMEPVFQRREPGFYSKRMLETYARHVAKFYPHPDDPGKKVTRVKTYRVVHNILS